MRGKWQRTLRYLLVDEYQDTNATQYELLKLLADPQYPLFTAVGDDDQSIYGWRGATLDNLKRLPDEFPQLKVIKLEQNYRSTGAILRAANTVIGHNPKLFPKKLWSDLGDGEPVQVVECDDEEHEAERAVARIQALRAHRGRRVEAVATSPCSTAPTTRRRVFEQALRKAQIPYTVSGGQSFFDRAEISDLCAWLRLLRQQRRRPGLPARGDHAQARHRPPDAGQRSASSPASGSAACSRRCSPSRSAACSARARSARCTSSAAT